MRSILRDFLRQYSKHQLHPLVPSPVNSDVINGWPLCEHLWERPFYWPQRIKVSLFSAPNKGGANCLDIKHTSDGNSSSSTARGQQRKKSDDSGVTVRATAATTTTTTTADKNSGQQQQQQQQQHLDVVPPSKPSVRVSSAPSLLVLSKSDGQWCCLNVFEVHLLQTMIIWRYNWTIIAKTWNMLQCPANEYCHFVSIRT